jgi:Ca-activated chloride channel family protein
VAAAIVCFPLVPAEPPRIRIITPTTETIVSGATRLEAEVSPDVGLERVSFFVDGRLACTLKQLPFACTWDPGAVVRGHHVRAVASFANGTHIAASVHTKEIGYAERVRTDAVLVPVVVKDHDRFVRGLTKADFEVREDGVLQSIASFAGEGASLDLIVAIDISGSMDRALPDVRFAVKQFLSKLRPGDTATLLGFNDNMFIVAEREKDPAARDKAIDLLASWGGTALYDTTVRAVDMVSRQIGRKGVVIFSDGDDRDSRTTRERAMEYVEASDAMLFTLGFGEGATSRRLRASLTSYAEATGGRAFFPRHSSELSPAFEGIMADLQNQYVLSYSPTHQKQDGGWRELKVRVLKGKYEVRARQGYRASVPDDPAR